MTTDEIIDGVLAREAGFTNHPADSGGPTNFGVTARVLGEWRKLGRPATRAEVEALTEPEARAIYEARYVRPFTWVASDLLRVQLVDYGVLSGPREAILALQRALNVEADGVIGPDTRRAIEAYPPWLVGRALVAARCRALSDLAERRPKDRVFLRGWVRRAVEFF